MLFKIKLKCIWLIITAPSIALFQDMTFVGGEKFVSGDYVVVAKNIIWENDRVKET